MGNTPAPLCSATGARPLALCGALLAAACAPGRPAAVSPADIPQLETAVRTDPTDGVATLRLAAAFLSHGDCDRAVTAARRGMELRPQDALGPLVTGDCLQRQGNAAEAIALYETFNARYPGTPGAAAVAARGMLARRAQATDQARQLVAAEAQTRRAPADRNVLAVMPLEIVGDEQYGPLSVGIANVLTSDLALIQRFRLVERIRLDALLEEIQTAQRGAVDPATAARAGRLLEAGTILHGVTLVPPDERLRLEVSLLDPSSQVVGSESVTGKLRDLLRLEKDLVLGIASRLGYQLSQAERRAILENGTQNLAAFLAYSSGLLDQQAGNYSAAALHFGRAVRADPAFRQARQAHGTTAAAAAVQQAGAQVTTLAGSSVPDAAQPTGAESAAGAVASGVLDVAPTQGEQLTGGAGSQQAAATSTATPPPSTTGTATQLVTFGFRFVFRFP